VLQYGQVRAASQGRKFPPSSVFLPKSGERGGREEKEEGGRGREGERGERRGRGEEEGWREKEKRGTRKQRIEGI
jgi:hypothetical protein